MLSSLSYTLTSRPNRFRTVFCYAMHCSPFFLPLLVAPSRLPFVFFFLNDPATPEIYPLPLHAALPISGRRRRGRPLRPQLAPGRPRERAGAGPRRGELGAAGAQGLCPDPPAVAEPAGGAGPVRSEEHTSELQSRLHLVCRLLLEKKKNK